MFGGDFQSFAVLLLVLFFVFQMVLLFFLPFFVYRIRNEVVEIRKIAELIAKRKGD